MGTKALCVHVKIVSKIELDHRYAVCGLNAALDRGCKRYALCGPYVRMHKQTLN